MTQGIIEQLDKQHNRNEFDCGVPELNGFLQRTARRNASNHISRTMVMVNSETPSEIMGFYMVVITSVKPPPTRAYRSYPTDVPGLLLARLAVDKKYQNNCLGTYLLIDALMKAKKSAEISAPIVGVFVNAKDAKVRRFYETFGFMCVETEGDPNYLWIPVATMHKLLDQLGRST
ncbi:GNAT family N-acetyltransferase [Gilvimarinus agarilyticus]|uniref:GNAT family N-acetyltransferase n=1 Tax=Gilvimarinus agarilyticus TaxID=679259 RepID=UPI0005A18850|nr:GNAT family N-acetyltransferase [Gilvimarinus agarilyticus]